MFCSKKYYLSQLIHKIILLFLMVTKISFAMELKNKEDEMSLHVYNLVPSQEASSYAWVMKRSIEELSVIHPILLPRQIDFSHTIPIIHDQGKLGSCTAQAITHAMESILYQQENYTLLSALYVYYNGRRITGNIFMDSGASLSDAIQAIYTRGACREKTWEYSDDQFKFRQKPPRIAYTEGLEFVDLDCISHSFVYHDLNAIKYKLAQNIPVFFGMYIYTSFENESVRRTGKVPIPERHERFCGGHAMTFVGYNDDTQEFKFANSWGKDWGDHGFGYLKYDYVMNKNAPFYQPYFYKDDMWSIKKIGKRVK